MYGPDMPMSDYSVAVANAIINNMNSALEESTASSSSIEFTDVVQEMQKANPNMKYSDAVDAVAREYPNLYEKYRAAHTPRGVR